MFLKGNAFLHTRITAICAKIVIKNVFFGGVFSSVNFFELIEVSESEKIDYNKKGQMTNFIKLKRWLPRWLFVSSVSASAPHTARR